MYALALHFGRYAKKQIENVSHMVSACHVFHQSKCASFVYYYYCVGSYFNFLLAEKNARGSLMFSNSKSLPVHSILAGCAVKCNLPFRCVNNEVRERQRK